MSVEVPDGTATVTLEETDSKSKALDKLEPENSAAEVQEQLDALMAASSKITKNPKCPRKHRQLLKVRVMSAPPAFVQAASVERRHQKGLQIVQFNLIFQDLESTLPLLDSQQLKADDNREDQFILNFVAKAKKFVDQEKIHEMISILRAYRDNLKQVNGRLSHTEY